MARREGVPSEPTSRAAGSSATGPGVTDKVQDAASRAAGAVQETAAPVVDKASDTAGQLANQASEQVSSRLDMGKDMAAERLTGVARALRETGKHLRQEGGQPALAGYADTGAQQLERFTGYLRQHDTHELVTQVESYARRNPTTFAAGAFAVGLLAARFFRSSSKRQHAPPPSRTGPAYGTAPAMAPSAARTGTGPTPTPPASQPPTYASVPPASRDIPTSPASTPPSAERITPVPGPAPTSGTGPTSTPGLGTSGSETGGGARTSSPGTRDERPETGRVTPSSDLPGPGGRSGV